MKQEAIARLEKTVVDCITFLNIPGKRVNELMSQIDKILDEAAKERWNNGAIAFAKFTLLAETPQEEQFLAFYAGISFGIYLNRLENENPWK